VRLLLDEMISPRIAQLLRDVGHDVVAVAEDVALRALPDDVLSEVATADDRVLVTRNVADFARLHQQWHTEGRLHHGLVMITQQAFPQNRSFVGALTASLLHSENRRQLPGGGEAIYLRNGHEQVTNVNARYR
jgi:hypothetical protein